MSGLEPHFRALDGGLGNPTHVNTSRFEGLSKCISEKETKQKIRAELWRLFCSPARFTERVRQIFYYVSSASRWSVLTARSGSVFWEFSTMFPGGWSITELLTLYITIINDGESSDAPDGEIKSGLR